MAQKPVPSHSLAIFSADPHSPTGHSAQSTLLLLLDYHSLFLQLFATAGTDATPIVSIASQLKSWAQSQDIHVAHALIDPQLPIPAHAKDPKRLAAVLAAAKANPAGLLEPDSIRDDKQPTFTRAPGYVSALSSPGLLEYTKAHSINSLILAGISTSGCVLRTAIDASEKGFVVTVVRDACADPADGVHEVTTNGVLPMQAHVVEFNALKTEWEKARGQTLDAEAQTVPNSQQDDSTALVDEADLKRIGLIMGAIWLGCFFAALDTTIVATITGPISSSFDSLSLLSWLGSGYLIANSACQPLSGKLTDIFSRRYGLMFSNIFFAIGTLICGLAPNAATMIAGRIIAGIGGGGLNCISTFVGSDLIPLRRRGLWQGFGNIIFGLGMGLGGIFGGFCADTLSWRWAFLLQLPFIVVSAAMVWFLVDIPVDPSTMPALSRIDFLGAGTLVTSLVFLLLGLNTGGNQLPWSHPFVITSLVLAFVTLLTFLYIESHPSLAPEPIIPVSVIIRSRTILAAGLANWFATMASFLFIYYTPLYLQIALDLSSTQAGLRVISFAAGTSLGSLVAGIIMNLTGRYCILNAVSMLVFVAGAALICTFQLNEPGWKTFVYLIPSGWGYGAMLTTTLVAMLSAADHKYQAVITAASYAFRSTGSSIGITLASAVYQNTLTNELHDAYGHMPNSSKIIDQIRNSLDAIKHLPKGWSESVVMHIYMDAFRGAFISGAILAVVALLAALAINEHVLHKNLSRRKSSI
ncbi:hypothetical protein DV736_g2769, partial [Chaetothyriales sp. CBS 134916]